MRRLTVLVIVAAVGLVLTASAAAILTPKPAYITLDPAVVAGGGTVTPIISVGEAVNGFTFEGLPDGIGVRPGSAANTVDVFVAHEQTTVPFFGTQDYVNASVSKLTLSTGPTKGDVLQASEAISPDGFLRFCSASMAGPNEGFSTYTFFTGEETDDVVDGVQRGYAVVLNTDTGDFTAVPGMGRLNHENTIAVPGGWPGHVLLTTDDTFNGPSAQLYMYQANHESHIFQDKGSLWAFRVTGTDDGRVKQNDPFNDANDYLDIRPGDDWQGEFIRVPKQIARGDQTALEDWSNENNVFQFIRLEDLAYDKNNPRVVYVADTGRSRVVPDPDTGRMVRGPSGTVGQADNGSIFRFEFNDKNPRKVDSFSVLAQGDDASGGAYVPFVSPDNIDTSANSLVVQEDADNAKIWRQDLSSGNWSVIATVNDTGGESSGIVDVSEWFGSGAWLLDVQAHDEPYVKSEVVDGVTFKQEDGQLMLMEIPGS